MEDWQESHDWENYEVPAESDKVSRDRSFLEKFVVYLQTHWLSSLIVLLVLIWTLGEISSRVF